ncbi:MAG: GNAT family N-acetyltransferase [Deltaproteobacteria bacterium]|nr:GNAT family N-acetyltransferase [Deltaproteobacteria bacterium]
MNIVSEIELRREHFSSFFDVPFNVYGKRFPFVSMLRGDLRAMLDPDKNPHWRSAERTFFTAFRNGKAVGRIVAHVHNAANERFKENVGSFGFFDLEDNGATAALLLREAEAYARARGCTKLRGNMNLSANQEIGVLVDGESHRPYLGQIYAPAYISNLLRAEGYQGTHPMTTWAHTNLQAFDVQAVLAPKHHALLADPAFTFRHFNMARFSSEVESIRQLLNQAMASNYLFVPLSPDEVQFQLAPLKAVVDPTLVTMVEHEGHVVGMALGVPDVVPLLQAMASRLLPFGWLKFLRQRKQMKGVSIIIIMVTPDYQSRGLIRVLTHKLWSAAQAGGYTRIGGTWIGDDNVASLKAAKGLGMEPLHRVEMFEKDLA